MKVKILILAVIILVVCSLTGVSGQIYCYTCNSYRDWNRTACLDPMSPNVPYYQCTSRGDVCSKVSYVTQKQFITSRSCDSSSCNQIQSRLRQDYPDLASFKCYQCNSNYCNRNSGVAVVMSLVTLVWGIIVTKIL